jgi:hypothetical protein
MITRDFHHVVTRNDVQFRLLLLKPMPVDDQYRFDGDYDYMRTLNTSQCKNLEHQVYSHLDLRNAKKALYRELWSYRMSITESDATVEHRMEPGYDLHLEVGEHKMRDNTSYVLVAFSESAGDYAVVSVSDPEDCRFDKHTMQIKTKKNVDF